MAEELDPSAQSDEQVDPEDETAEDEPDVEGHMVIGTTNPLGSIGIGPIRPVSTPPTTPVPPSGGGGGDTIKGTTKPNEPKIF